METYLTACAFEADIGSSTEEIRRGQALASHTVLASASLSISGGCAQESKDFCEMIAQNVILSMDNLNSVTQITLENNGGARQ